MDIFWNDHISPRDINGRNSNIFNHNKFYRSINCIIVGLNDSAKANNGYYIMIVAERAISELLKLKTLDHWRLICYSDIYRYWSNFPHVCIVQHISGQMTRTLQAYWSESLLKSILGSECYTRIYQFGGCQEFLWIIFFKAQWIGFQVRKGRFEKGHCVMVYMKIWGNGSVIFIIFQNMTSCKTYSKLLR